MPQSQSERSDPSRRALLRAGVIGAAGLGLVEAVSRSAEANFLSSGEQTCPCWFMGYSQDSMGNTLYDYYSYQFPDGCGMPDLTTGAMIVSSTPLFVGCDGGSCSQKAIAAPRKSTPDDTHSNVDIPCTFNPPTLAMNGLKAYAKTWAYPFVDITYDYLHKVKGTQNPVLVRLTAAKFTFMLGGKAQSPALFAFGREVDPNNPPTGVLTKEDLAPDAGGKNKYRVFRHAVNDSAFGNGNGSYGFHTLFLNDPGV